MLRNPYTYLLLLCFCLVACTTGEPRVLKVNGHTRVYTEHKVLGVPYKTDVEEIKTADQVKADQDAEARERRLKTEAKRASLAMWLGALLMLSACVCAVIGYLTKGWKRWGGLTALCAFMGGLCWGFVEWIPYLKWIVLALMVSAVGMFLYDKRDFEWNKGKEE